MLDITVPASELEDDDRPDYERTFFIIEAGLIEDSRQMWLALEEDQPMASRTSSMLRQPSTAQAEAAEDKNDRMLLSATKWAGEHRAPDSPLSRPKMPMRSVFRIIVPPGEYVLGDPVYSVPEDQWDELLASSRGFTLPIGRIEGHQVLAFFTMHGDGVYRGPEAAEISVDSGLIGLVPAGLPRLRTNMARLTCRVVFDRPVMSENCEDGTLIFGPHSIATGDVSEED